MRRLRALDFSLHHIMPFQRTNGEAHARKGRQHDHWLCIDETYGREMNAEQGSEPCSRDCCGISKEKNPLFYQGSLAAQVN